MGGTTIADLGSHLIDLATGWLGPVESVRAKLGDVRRPSARRRRDAARRGRRRVLGALLRFASGARGTMEVARAAPRRPCDFIVEVNGSRGTAMFAYASLNELWYASADDDPRLYGLRRIRAEHPSHPQRPGWWPIGQGVGYDATFINQACRPARGVARRALDARLRPGRARRRGVRRDGALGGDRPLGDGQRGDL